MQIEAGFGWLVILGLIFFSVLYFVIKWGVAAGILRAEELRREKANAPNGEPPSDTDGKNV